MCLGDQIKYHRKKNGLSQDELAEKIGVSRQSVSLWEKNKTIPTMKNLVAISEIFGVTVGELLYNDHDVQQGDVFGFPFKADKVLGSAKTSWDAETIKKAMNLFYRKKLINRSILSAVGFLYWIGSVISLLTSNADKFSEPAAYIIFVMVFAVIWVLFSIPLILQLNRRRKSIKGALNSTGETDVTKVEFRRCGIGFCRAEENPLGNFFAYYNEIQGIFLSEKILAISCGSSLYPVKIQDIEGDKDEILGLLARNVRYLYTTDVIYRYPKCKMPREKIKRFNRVSWILFFAAIITFFAAALCQMSFIKNTESPFNIIAIIAGALPLVLAIGSLVMSIAGKAKGMNVTGRLVISAVITLYSILLLFILSAFSWDLGLGSSYVPADYSLLTEIEDKTDMDFPDTGELLRRDVGVYSSYINTPSVQTAFVSDNALSATFTDLQETRDFENYLKESANWIKNVSDFPELFSGKFGNVRDYQYFCIFNVTTGEINYFENLPGTYELIYLKYDEEENKLDIIEYTFTLTNT